MAGEHNKKARNTLGTEDTTLHRNLVFTATEQYKLLRANLSFALPDEEGCKIIGVTSSIRGEGKSTTSINLSYVLAEAGERVVLVDGDLRLPSVAKKMHISNARGLTDSLKNSETQIPVIVPSDLYSNWGIIPSGPLPPNPSELLSSKRMENFLASLSKFYDYIIVDLPPVNAVSDAIAISKYLTGIVLVIREDYTEKNDVNECFRQLRLANVNVLGCVMNGVKNEQVSKYSRYKRYSKYYKRGYYSDSYYQSTQTAEEEDKK